MKVQVGHLCVYIRQTGFEYLFLSCFEVDLVAWWNSSQYRLRACHDIFGVLCTVYSLLPHCFIWTFLTRIALNYARWGAVWQPLKMKYLLVFSQATDRRVRPFTWSNIRAPDSQQYLQYEAVFCLSSQRFRTQICHFTEWI